MHLSWAANNTQVFTPRGPYLYIPGTFTSRVLATFIFKTTILRKERDSDGLAFSRDDALLV